MRRESRWHPMRLLVLPRGVSLDIDGSLHNLCKLNARSYVINMGLQVLWDMVSGFCQ